MNISMKEAQTRLRRGMCLSCGTEKQTSVELSSCNNPKCVKELRQLYRWARDLGKSLTDPVKTCYTNTHYGGKNAS